MLRHPTFLLRTPKPDEHDPGARGLDVSRDPLVLLRREGPERRGEAEHDPQVGEGLADALHEDVEDLLRAAVEPHGDTLPCRRPQYVRRKAGAVHPRRPRNP